MDMIKRYFYGQLNVQEETMVKEWLMEHSEDPEVINALDAIMNESAKEDRSISSAAFAEVCSRLGIEKKRGSRIVKRMAHWSLKVAVYIVFLCIGAISYRALNPVQEVQWQEIKVPHGETETLQLADGTLLHLNSGSRITYPSAFPDGERRIFMAGEIYAEVAADHEHPFVISTADVDVKVLGTTFNFKSYDDSDCVELLLLSGEVEADINAHNRTKKLTLHPGEMIQFDRESGEIDFRDFNPITFRGFHENRAIHFFNLRLSDIAEDLERLFGVKTVILDEKLAETRYFALFTNNESLDQILKGIDMENQMVFNRKENVIYISRK